MIITEPFASAAACTALWELAPTPPKS